MRPKMIIGNWKLHKKSDEARNFFNALKRPPEGIMVGITPTFTSIAAASVVSGTVDIGSQDISDQKEGSFTGEVSLEMVQDAGAKFTLIGHSERRQHYKESDERIKRKVNRAVEASFPFILCIGETSEERASGVWQDVLKRQLEALPAEKEGKYIAVAYEPVWAIGSGKMATAEEAKEVHSFIRDIVGPDVYILYGGSVTAERVSELLSLENVDGCLVGNASLELSSFEAILHEAEKLLS